MSKAVGSEQQGCAARAWQRSPASKGLAPSSMPAVLLVHGQARPTVAMHVLDVSVAHHC